VRTLRAALWRTTPSWAFSGNTSLVWVSSVFLFLRVIELKLVVNRETHPCSALCSENGICQIDTAHQSIEATVTARQETFQYTKVIESYSIIRCASLRISCLVLVYTRFVESQSLGIALTPNQLQNGCSALGRFRLDERHMEDSTPIATKTSHFTSARLGG
jgi:hypothetical protein